MPNVNLLRDYSPTFWTANVMELFERAAYYGMNSILAGYLTLAVAEGGLGFSTQAVGFLQGIVYAVTYVVPILGGALADRYGYRRMLMAAFSLLACGYFAAGFMSSYALVFLALLVMATGSGLFKPIISGTIARTTDETNSAFGFGIYYWMINLGAFLGPLMVSYLKGFSWRYVFLASALYVGLMLLPNAVLFSDPPRPASTKKLTEVLLGAAEVLGAIAIAGGLLAGLDGTLGATAGRQRHAGSLDARPVSQPRRARQPRRGVGLVLARTDEGVARRRALSGRRPARTGAARRCRTSCSAGCTRRGTGPSPPSRPPTTTSRWPRRRPSGASPASSCSPTTSTFGCAAGTGSTGRS